MLRRSRREGYGMALQKGVFFDPRIWLGLGAIGAVVAVVSFAEAGTMRSYYGHQGIGYAILSASLWVGAAILYSRRPLG
jgi:drug/metabolite transporter (DMT)-like permease